MQSKILYFEDYQVGEKGETCGRTLTDVDLVQFCSLAADFSPAHLDYETMVHSQYGKRVAPGWLIGSLATGMFSYHAPYIVGRDTPTAYLHGITARYPYGWVLGDTVKFHWSIKEKAEDLTQPGFGIVKTDWQFITQEGNIAGEGTVTTGVRMRGAEGAKPQFKPGTPWEYKEWVPDFDKVYFLEDLVVGEGEKTGGRVITETDVVNFMGLIGDDDRLYLDPTYAKETVYGERIAPPMLVADYCSLMLRDGTYFNIKKLESPYIGHLGDEVSFLAPARIGDVIHAVFKIESTRVSKTKPERGIFTYGQQAVNQRNEVLVEIHTGLMLPVRAAAPPEPYKTMWVLHTIKRG